MPKTQKTSLKNLDVDAALRSILEGTSSETGKEFFKALVKNLAQTLNVKGAWVTELLHDSNRLRALAFWSGDRFVDKYEYDIAGTPCQAVIKSTSLQIYSEDLIELFPNDPDLEPFGAVSYMGVPLKDVDGKILGHLAIQDTQPMPEQPRALALFRIFAARATAELQRLRAEQEIRDREEKLSRLVDSAMDAIIELDQDLKVTRVNTAAEKAFKCSSEIMLQKDIKEFFSTDSHHRIHQLLKKLDAQPEGQQYVWIPEGLDARCHTGEMFPAEATISRFEMHHHSHYTLILRNVNEKIEAEQKIRSLAVETEYLREEIKALQDYGEVIGESKPLQRVLEDVRQVGPTDTSVLILGETGTGKEVVARAIHASSKRKDKPLIKVNCAAIPTNLIESELFGHEKGAFTGATTKRDGRFTLADSGTVFLDEIGELPLELQVKLLRVLQEGEFEPVGSSQTTKVDVRVLAATNRKLEQEVEKGNFREDLYFRLNVFPIEVPPLRERGEDVVLMANAFIGKIARRMGRKLEPLSPDCVRRLKAYYWPGNVRELQNVIERAVITAKNGKINLDRALPETGDSRTVPEPAGSTEDAPQIRTARELMELEKNNIMMALEAASWKVSGEQGAAKLLGMPPSTLSSRMKALGIKRSR